MKEAKKMHLGNSSNTLHMEQVRSSVGRVEAMPRLRVDGEAARQPAAFRRGRFYPGHVRRSLNCRVLNFTSMATIPASPSSSRVLYGILVVLQLHFEQNQARRWAFSSTRARRRRPRYGFIPATGKRIEVGQGARGEMTTEDKCGHMRQRRRGYRRMVEKGRRGGRGNFFPEKLLRPLKFKSRPMTLLKLLGS